MDKQLSILLFLVFHILLTHFRLAKCDSAISICSQTPHPNLCNTLLTTFPHKTLDKNYVVLSDLSLRATLRQATNAHKLISEMDSTSFNELGRSAWDDCLELYQDTIYHLNRSIGSKIEAFDAQTWLSAAIANEQTCHNGFLDFNLSSHLETFQLMVTNFSKSLSNSLAINKAISSSSTTFDDHDSKQKRNSDHFPNWVSAGDRRLLQSSRSSVKADIVVAQDGSGDYTTISEGLAAAKARRGSSARRFVIYVKKGVYRENVEIKRSMKNLMFIGDGIDATVVSGDKNVLDGFTTFRSATFAVSGEGFIARGMTFENTAGPDKHQAVALRSGSDFSVFYGCSFKGYQDTLYLHSLRQFYRDCHVYGTVDFIFGDAVAVLQNCNIYVRKPMINQKNTVTAQARKDPNEITGIVIHNSVVTAAPDLRPVQNLYRSYLGRPWKKYSRTVFCKCVIDDLIDPAGWLPWNGDFGLSTLYYGEYMNSGGGASTRGRVRWPGFHDIRAAEEAERFSVRNFIAGDMWIPATGVPFTSGV